MYTQILEHGDYILRPSHKLDETTVQEVVFTVLKEYGLVPEPNGVDNDLFDLKKHYKNGHFGVVIYNQNIVGTYGISALDEDIAEIRKMYLLKEHRGKGLGSFILRHLTSLAKANGFNTLELETASVLKEAVQLYNKKGFTLINRNNMTERCNRVFTKDIS